MNQKGTAYILALFCLLAVSATSLLWQRQLASYSASVLDAWSDVTADQAALSGIEYAVALLENSKIPTSPLKIRVPGGACKLTFTRKQDALLIRSEAVINAGRGARKAVYEMKRRLPHPVEND